MFNRKFKLIGTAIGLVAVLVMGLAMPGATQQNPLTRENLIQLINRVYAPTLTASEGDIWDTQCAGLYSSPFMTFTFIPASPESRSIQRLIAGDHENVTLFAFHIHDDGGSKPIVKRQLPAGSYTAKLVSPTKVIFVDQEGNEVLSGSVEITRADKPSVPYLPCFPGRAEIGFTLLTSQQSHNMTLDAFGLADGEIYGEVEYCYAWCFVRIKVKIVIACTAGDDGQSLAQSRIPGVTRDKPYILDGFHR